VRTSAVDLAGRNVLVVDDNATNRQLLSRQLGGWGISVATAATGPVALDLLRSAVGAGQPFDLAILDMQMPDLDGVMLARAIRADAAIARVPLALLTSLGQGGLRDEHADVRFVGILTRPVGQSQLHAWLGSVFDTPHAPAPEVTEPIRSTVEPGAGASIRRILVAEDNVVNQRVVVRMLERLGYHVDLVNTGAEAVDASARQAYAAILMDCQMPEMDGYEATGVIRVRERQSIDRGGRRVPIIALTANAMATDRDRCLAAGMDEYLAKPVRPDRLASLLVSCLDAAASVPAEAISGEHVPGTQEAHDPGDASAGRPRMAG